MHTILDYIAWIAIALAAAAVLFVVLAICLLLAQGVTRITRWISNPRTTLSGLLTNVLQASVRIFHEAAHLARQQQKIAAAIHVHSGRTKRRA
jgi:uncharacterized protein YoxC